MADDRLSAATEDALRKALQAAYLELKKHDAEYHHRTPINVNSMIVDALALTGDAAQGAFENARQYVDRAIASYAGDPADNQFQKGFLAALEVVRDEAFASQPSPAATVDRRDSHIYGVLETEQRAHNGSSAATGGAEEAIRDWWYSDRREPMTSKEAAKSLIWYLAKCGLKIIRDEPQTAPMPKAWAILHVNCDGIWKLTEDKRSADYWETQGFPVEPLLFASQVTRPQHSTGDEK